MLSKVGLSTLFCLNDNFENMMENIVKFNVKYIEIVDEGLHTLDKTRIKVLNELAGSYKLEYMVHAPFADVNIASPTNVFLDAMLTRLKESIVNASLLGCKIWVFHPGLETGLSMFHPKVDWDRNLRSTLLLSRFANDHGVKVAVENMPAQIPFVMKTVKDFEKFIQETEQDIYLAMDVGHANINNHIEEFLMTFADKIAHIHVHDNDGKRDQHLGIGFGTVYWQEVLQLIDKISYEKIVVVESISHVKESLDRLRSDFYRS